MGQSAATSGLSANCPICDKQHSANSLDILVQAVRRCCKTKRVKVTYAKTLMQRPPLPTLPVTRTFDRLVVSQNETTYSHWSVYSKDHRDWKMRCMVVLLEMAGLDLWWSHWSVVREYMHPHKELDYANLVGGAKPLIDCLVQQRIIRDDKPKHFLCDYAQRTGTSNRTILTLENYREEIKPQKA